MFLNVEIKRMQATRNPIMFLSLCISRFFSLQTQEHFVSHVYSLVKSHIKFLVRSRKKGYQPDGTNYKHPATKLILEQRTKTYTQLLEQLKLIPLERIRLKGQLIKSKGFYKEAASMGSVIEIKQNKL